MARKELTDAQLEERFFKNKPGRPAKEIAVQDTDHTVDADKIGSAMEQMRAEESATALALTQQNERVTALAMQLNYNGSIDPAVLENSAKDAIRRIGAGIFELGGYASGHVLALAGGTKWSADTGTSVTDIDAAKDVIRKKIGKKPNRLTLSADAYTALRNNKQVLSRLPSTFIGTPGINELKTILEIEDIVVGDAVWIDDTDTGRDVWGNNAILAYVPKIGGSGSSGADISLAEPAFGFTNVIEGHPFSETPYYDNSSKSWIYGATYERRPNVAYPTAGFLFTNPK